MSPNSQPQNITVNPETGTNTQYILGQMLTNLANVKNDIGKLEKSNEKVSQLETEIKLARQDITSIKESLQKAENKKAPWFSVAGGIGAISACVISVGTILTVFIAR